MKKTQFILENIELIDGFSRTSIDAVYEIFIKEITESEVEICSYCDSPDWIKFWEEVNERKNNESSKKIIKKRTRP